MKNLLMVVSVLALAAGIAMIDACKPASEPSERKTPEAATGTRVNPKDGLTYVWISPGTFTMGCSTGDSNCEADEQPAHTVTITKGFWMGQTTATVGAWKRFRTATGKEALTPSDNEGRKLNEAAADDSPAVLMNWDEAQEFCGWSGMRLPTEAEWEYAARAGSTAATYGNLDDIAWYGDNSGRQHIDSATLWRDDKSNYSKRLFENGNFQHPVARKAPNQWKLYDMLGNVWQWTNDWYGEKYYASGENRDPRGPSSGQYRVARGFTWSSIPKEARVSYRIGQAQASATATLGVRCVADH
jgi:sulfatase modifying factor 1